MLGLPSGVARFLDKAVQRDKVLLQSIFPIAWASAAMGNGQDQDFGVRFSINQQERKTRELDLAGASRSPWPTLRRGHNLVNDLVEFVDESSGGERTALPIPAPRIRLPQWRPDERSIVERSFDRVREASLGFLEQDWLDLARIEVRHAAGDLFVPSSGDGIVFRVVQTLNQRAREVGALVYWQSECFLQELGGFTAHGPIVPECLKVCRYECLRKRFIEKERRDG